MGGCFDVGTYLVSRAVTSQVPSARASLTSVFGMGTGGPSPSSAPTLFFAVVPDDFDIIPHFFEECKGFSKFFQKIFEKTFWEGTRSSVCRLGACGAVPKFEGLAPSKAFFYERAFFTPFTPIKIFILSFDVLTPSGHFAGRAGALRARIFTSGARAKAKSLTKRQHHRKSNAEAPAAQRRGVRQAPSRGCGRRPL